MKKKNTLNIKKRITNPMTIIGIFALISETSAAVSLPFLDNTEREIYIWFLISFPFYLLLLFFITLNFNYLSLYAPSDFDNDDHFLKALEDHKNTANPQEKRRTDNAPDPPVVERRVTSLWVEYAVQLSKPSSLLSIIDVRLINTQIELDKLKEAFPLHGKQSSQIIMFLTDSTSDALFKQVALSHSKHIKKTTGSTLYLVYNVCTRMATILKGN